MNALLKKYGFTPSEQMELGIPVVLMETVRTSYRPKAIKMGSLSGLAMLDDGPRLDVTCVCSLNFGEVMCATIE